MTLRFPIHVELFNENGESVYVINSTKKSQIKLRLQAFSRKNWAFGTCRVWYNKREEFYNEFRFTKASQLEEGLIACTEKPLVDFLKSIIPGEYLEKRQMSASQLKALKRARTKSPIQAGLPL